MDNPSQSLTFMHPSLIHRWHYFYYSLLNNVDKLLHTKYMANHPPHAVRMFICFRGEALTLKNILSWEQEETGNGLKEHGVLVWHHFALTE